MSINNIKKLSMNPHFYSLLMQSFLSGYEKPCEIKLPFMAIPISPLKFHHLPRGVVGCY